MNEDQAIAAQVDEHGWSAIEVNDANQPFIYTVGLMYTARHPELIVFGLPEHGYSLLSALVQLIQQGKSFAQPRVYADVLEELTLAVRPVHPSQHETYLGYAMAHCRIRGEIGRLDAVQVFWPDKEGNFPFDGNCDLDVAMDQPLLNRDDSDDGEE